MNTSNAYNTRIRTDSADSNALMIHHDGELVAILVELADECHGDARGRWAFEAVFGEHPGRWPSSFATPAEAERWILSQPGHSLSTVDCSASLRSKMESADHTEIVKKLVTG